MGLVVCNHEAARLQTLRQYQILGTSPEQAFDDIVLLAAQTCGTPIALINLIDANRQWIKAKEGLDIDEISMDVGFCPICIQQGEMLIIPDTLADERFANNPFVISERVTRFYAGVPLIAPEGEILGTLCILDYVPRKISPKQVETLKALSRLAVRQMELRRDLAELTSVKQSYEQAQKELQQSESTLRSLFASAPMMMGIVELVNDAIIVQDLSNKILLWNKTAEELYGWRVEEVLGKNAHEVLYNGPISQQLEIYKTVLKQGSWQGELQKTTRHGKEITVASRWTLLRDEFAHAKSILIVDTDITQKKQLEKQFLRAQRMESIGTLASGIAHDLNNTLSPILMSAQMLKMKCDDERSRQMLSIVENNAQRGANLVKQMLSFARGIEGDRTVLQLKHLIVEMQQIVKQTFPKSMTIYTEVQSNLWSVCGDSTQLHQVLMNLCLNARDAMPRGGVLQISAKNIVIDENYARMHLDAQVGSYVMLTVADTGIGISNELLDKIFEPFFTTKEFGQGTGLGLSTVMGIIKSHGGFITVSSCIGKGTKFKVYLPAVESTTVHIPKDLETPSGYGQWVLVVDDEAAVREVTKISLENNNYKAMTASDGIEAVALYAQHKDKISAAIVDMMMPNMDGAMTISTLHKINPLLRIIAVSGLVNSEYVTLEKTSQLTAFLPKPYTAQELLKTLHTVMGQSS